MMSDDYKRFDDYLFESGNGFEIVETTDRRNGDVTAYQIAVILKEA